MSLKHDPKARSSISRFLSALLRPFMSEPPPPGLPYLRFHTPHGLPVVMGVGDWNVQISQSLDGVGDNSYAKCSLHYVEYCKCSHGVQHEFLVFHFGHWNRDSSAVGVVCADRTVVNNQDNSSSSGQSSGIASPSSSDNVAHDTVSILGSPRNARSYLTQTYGSFKTLCRLTFTSSSRPSSLQVSTILSLVNNVSLLYRLFDRQCYWYADTVWRSLKRIFPENEELCYDHNARSRYGPFLLGPSDESVGVVCDRYESAWDITLKQWTQARDCHAAQRAQFREEGRAERKHEIEEMRSEQQHQIEEMRSEQQRQIEEMRSEQQRQIEEMRSEQQRQIEEMRSEQQRQIEEIRLEQQRQNEEIHSEQQRQLEEMQAELERLKVASRGRTN